MNWSLPSWMNNESVANTFTLIILIILTRFIITRLIKAKKSVLSGEQRRWLSIVQNASILLILLGLLYIWSPQLSAFALSLTAFAVAMVIATKEYLLCVVGALYRATSSPFSVGDWIEINGLRGEVLSEGILATRLQELGRNSGRFEYTGRVLSIPNSMFLTQTIFNESYRKHYLHHDFRVSIDAGFDPLPILKSMQERLSQLSADTKAESEVFWSRLRNKTQTDLPSRDCKIHVETTDIAKIVFVVTIFCAASKARQLETELTSSTLSAVSSSLKSKD